MLVTPSVLKRQGAHLHGGGFVIEASNAIDRQCGSLLRVRRRWCHPFGLSPRGRKANIALRCSLLLSSIGLVIGSSAVQPGPSWLLVMLLAAGLAALAMVGFVVDAPRSDLVGLLERGSLVLVAIVLLAAASSTAFWMIDGNRERSFVFLCFALGLMFECRALLSAWSTGAMWQRRFRRSAAVFTGFMIVGLGVAFALRSFSFAFPTGSDPSSRADAVLRVLGAGLSAAGWMLIVLRRRQRLAARLVTTIDAVVADVVGASQGSSVDRSAVRISIQMLDRLLNAGLDSASPIFCIRFESHSLRQILILTLQRGFELEDGSDVELPQNVRREFDRLGPEQCRVEAQRYLMMLRGQLTEMEDVLAT